MPKWIGGSRVSIARFWVKEFLAEGEPRLRAYVNDIRKQYVEQKAEISCEHDAYDLAELVKAGKYAAAAYRKAYGKECPR
jgi:hypothetical protein